MSKMSREKGKRGEREVAELFRSHGFEARRGVQYTGSPDSPDVVSGLEWLHIEVKRTESLSVYTAMAQAVSDAGDKTPSVFHRRNKHNWLVILRADDFLKLVRRLGHE